LANIQCYGRKQNRQGKGDLHSYLAFSVERLACKSSKHIVAISEIDKQRLIKLYGVDKEKIIVVLPFMNLDKFQKASLRESTSAGGERVTVIFHNPYNYPANHEAFGFIIDYITPGIEKPNGNIQFVLASIHAPVLERGTWRNARIFVKQKFDWDKIVHQWYEKVSVLEER